ncbi:MAG: flavodoxin domain-containing protein [Candidatus Gygaella obscura]|nr:flavodoxin domain-containing protein [Candidatus Gygaella obscura]
MKSAICFYSFSGNTKAVAKVLKEALSQKGNVDLIELKPKNGSKNFFIQGMEGFTKKIIDILPVRQDFSEYDLVVIGSPVWAFGPTPTVRAFLKNISGLNNKQAIVFVTSRRIGDQRALKEMESFLKEKGAQQIKQISINHNRIKDTEYLKQQIEKKID